MMIKILCPTWGLQAMGFRQMLDRIKNAGYDGLDTWIPDDSVEKKVLFDYLQKNELLIVAHQHQARGSTFKAFQTSFLKELRRCAEPGPVLINSHTGHDYFSLQQHTILLDLAAEFTDKTGIVVAHETHRGRLGYSPQMFLSMAKKRPGFPVTADLSHWVCVTESLLDNFTTAVKAVIESSIHIHARVGYEQGPQVPDPGLPEWRYALDKFAGWWDEIVAVNKQKGREIMTFTTEFGPFPYMMSNPDKLSPIEHQFALNLFMKKFLMERYRT
ncbi:hypothetical protein OQX61_12265 [Pedobacter sp. PLR]|uniref:sugar phosphate isomerase/epimerase family protein n=1 Tax=Pedobacter sp. PLR TaxID=2994465 RepID=UPI0022473315|nr:hypothetical protein [Pedobacter sp. PLR]MCX2452037.1 hypothetical protein [Pedobacter sp. PLR]